MNNFSFGPMRALRGIFKWRYLGGVGHIHTDADIHTHITHTHTRRRETGIIYDYVLIWITIEIVSTLTTGAVSWFLPLCLAYSKDWKMLNKWHEDHWIYTDKNQTQQNEK